MTEESLPEQSDSEESEKTEKEEKAGKLRWYVVHAYSGFEAYIMEALQKRIKFEGKEKYFGEIMVPKEQTIDLEITIEQALRFFVSGGVVAPDQQQAAALPALDSQHREKN